MKKVSAVLIFVIFIVCGCSQIKNLGEVNGSTFTENDLNQYLLERQLEKFILEEVKNYYSKDDPYIEYIDDKIKKTELLLKESKENQIQEYIRWFVQLKEAEQQGWILNEDQKKSIEESTLEQYKTQNYIKAGIKKFKKEVDLSEEEVINCILIPYNEKAWIVGSLKDKVINDFNLQQEDETDGDNLSSERFYVSILTKQDEFYDKYVDKLYEKANIRLNY